MRSLMRLSSMRFRRLLERSNGRIKPGKFECRGKILCLQKLSTEKTDQSTPARQNSEIRNFWWLITRKRVDLFSTNSGFWKTLVWWPRMKSQTTFTMETENLDSNQQKQRNYATASRGSPFSSNRYQATESPKELKAEKQNS